MEYSISQMIEEYLISDGVGINKLELWRLDENGVLHEPNFQEAKQVLVKDLRELLEMIELKSDLFSNNEYILRRIEDLKNEIFDGLLKVQLQIEYAIELDETLEEDFGKLLDDIDLILLRYD